MPTPSPLEVGTYGYTTFGLNVYAGFRMNTNDIAYLRVRGDGFAFDDLQFAKIPHLPLSCC
jgi:hypothetical protein